MHLPPAACAPLRVLLRLALPAALAAAALAPVAAAQTAAPGNAPAGARPVTRRWDGDSLRADVDALGRVLTAFHPALATYAPRAAFDARLAALRASFAGPTAPTDAVRRLAQFVTAVRDGHLFLNPYNQGAFVADTVLGGATRLPFTCRVLAGNALSHDAVVVTRDLTPDGVLPAGTVVRAFDGVPAAAVLDSLQTVSRGDGHTDALRRARLGVRDDQAAARRSDAPLDLYAALFFPPTDGGPTVGPTRRLAVRRPGATRDTTVAVRLVTHDERRARLARQDPAAGGVRWRARRLDARTAVVTAPSFVTYGDEAGRAGPAPVRWLDSTLATLTAGGIDRLVVDVRGNVGGSTDLAYAVARRLAPPGRAVPCDAIGRVLVAGPAPDTAAARYASSWRDDWRRPLPPGSWRRAADGRAELIADSAGAFRSWPVYGRACEPPTPGERPVAWPGRAAVLADEANASATFLFLTLVRRHGLAPVVGRPAGGNRRGINGGLILFTRLPYSGVEVDVPFFAQELAEAPVDAALVPDVPAPWTAADIAAGRDPDLAAARRLLAQQLPGTRPPPRSARGPAPQGRR